MAQSSAGDNLRVTISIGTWDLLSNESAWNHGQSLLTHTFITPKMITNLKLNYPTKRNDNDAWVKVRSMQHDSTEISADGPEKIPDWLIKT